MISHWQASVHNGQFENFTDIHLILILRTTQHTPAKAIPFHHGTKFEENPISLELLANCLNLEKKFKFFKQKFTRQFETKLAMYLKTFVCFITNSTYNKY